MNIWWGCTLACSINVRARLGARTRHHVKTLDTTSSQPNPEILAACEVLAHPHTVFYPYTCGLHRGVAAVLISYDDVKVAIGMITRRRRSWLTTYSTLTRDYVGSLLQPFFCCTMRLVVMIHDLLLTSILGWHGRSSISVTYPYPYSGVGT
jgi:hypothetical protein